MVGGGGVESKFSVQLRPKLNNNIVIMKLNNIPIPVFPIFPSLNLDIDNSEDIPVIFGIMADPTNISLP